MRHDPTRRGRGVPLAAAVLIALLGAGCGELTAAGPNSENGSTLLASGEAKWRDSWNPNISCRARVTSLARILGDATSSQGGATYHDGFKPGIPNRRAFDPPCNVNGHHTFVQLNGVAVGDCSNTGINKDGDWDCALHDLSSPSGRSQLMNHIHIETDEKFRAANGWSIPPFTEKVRVQGFVFWDASHTGASWHFYSGWEMHSFTAWKPPAK